MHFIIPNRVLLSGFLLWLERRAMSLEIIHFVVGVCVFWEPKEKRLVFLYFLK